MLRNVKEQKDKVNVLLNVDNFYGQYTGNLGRLLLFSVAACAPFLLYALVLMNFIPFRIFIVPYILYVIYMALLIIGRQRERVEAFIKQRNDEYATATDLIRIADIHDDGLVEYVDGNVCYIISAFGYSYLNDHAYSKDMEVFLSKFTPFYNVSVHGHLVYDEYGTTQEDLEKLVVYEDKDFLKERLDFYKYQDQYSKENTRLYRLNFVIQDYKTNWTKLKKYIDSILESEVAALFDTVYVCSREQAISVISRDMCMYVDLGEMLRAKHSSDKYFGSKILYFDDEIPDELVEHQYDMSEEGRRITDDF